MAKVRQATAPNVFLFFASLILLIATGAVCFASYNGRFTEKVAEYLDLGCLGFAFLIYFFDTIGILEKYPKVVNIARSLTLTTILIPLILRFYNEEFIVTHWKGCLAGSVVVFVICLIWCIIRYKPKKSLIKN